MYDVIVVGSGIAGSYIASKLNANVLVLEKDKKVILKDSGIVSTNFKTFFKEKALIQNKIKEITFVSPSGKQFSLNSESPFAYILKRKQFSLYLRQQARKNAKIRYETVKKINHLSKSVEVSTDKATYEARLVIGADGVSSIVRKSVDIQEPIKYTGIFTRTKKPFTTGNIKIHLNKYFSPDFFSWIIPQNNEYGVITSIRPYEYFQYFKKQMDLPDSMPCCSLIPIGYTKSHSNRTLLVGDSCSQTKPITGGGIIFSLIAAKHAINIVNQACKEKNFSKSFISQYEKLWKKDLRWEIRKQLILRKIYRNLTNNEIDKLFKDFGQDIEKLKDFDYDKFSSSWNQMPKWKMFKFFLSKLPTIL